MRAIFGQMTLKGREKLPSPQPALKLLSPPIEHLLGLVREPYGGNTFFVFASHTQALWVQGIEPLEDLVGSVLRLSGGPAVYVPPGYGRVRPHQQLKAL